MKELFNFIYEVDHAVLRTKLQTEERSSLTEEMDDAMFLIEFICTDFKL